ASAQHLPVKFSAKDNVLWSAPLGDGIGSPVVAAGRVFSTAFVGDKPEKRQFVTFCLDAATGKELWRKALPVGPKPLPAITPPNSYASASAAADAERVYVYFIRFGLLALDAKTGAQVWHVPMPEPFYIFDWGAGMSPVLYKDTVFFCQDDDLYPALYAIDKRTGKILWQDDRSDMAVSYSHPVVC